MVLLIGRSWRREKTVASLPVARREGSITPLEYQVHIEKKHACQIRGNLGRYKDVISSLKENAGGEVSNR